jgi:hypothetical protein
LWAWAKNVAGTCARGGRKITGKTRRESITTQIGRLQLKVANFAFCHNPACISSHATPILAILLGDPPPPRSHAKMAIRSLALAAVLAAVVSQPSAFVRIDLPDAVAQGAMCLDGTCVARACGWLWPRVAPRPFGFQRPLGVGVEPRAGRLFLTRFAAGRKHRLLCGRNKCKDLKWGSVARDARDLASSTSVSRDLLPLRTLQGAGALLQPGHEQQLGFLPPGWRVRRVGSGREGREGGIDAV